MDKETRLLEAAALGAAILEPRASDELVERVRTEDFYFEGHRVVFDAIKELKSRGKPVGLPEIVALLRRNGNANAAGGAPGVADLLNAATTTKSAQDYAEEVRRAAVLRKIKAGISNLNPEADPQTVEKIIDLIRERDTGLALPIVTANVATLEYLEALDQGRVGKAVVKTGFPTFDRQFHAQPGDVVVIAARPNIGKTALMANISKNILEDGGGVVFCPTEMRPSQFMGRVFPLYVDVEAWKFRAGALTYRDIELVTGQASQKLHEANLAMLDLASPTILEIEQAVKKHQPNAVMVDYLSRCSMPQAETYARQVADFMKGLKDMSVREGVVTFLAVQLSRRAEIEKGPPRLADLADSSAIEKEADAVIFLWKPQTEVRRRWAKAKSTPPGVNAMNNALSNPTIEAFFGKNRFGYLARFNIDFNRDFVRMKEEQRGKRDDDDEHEEPPLLGGADAAAGERSN